MLLSHDPSLQIEVVRITTTGDGDRRSFRAIGGKGLFVAEVEHQVALGNADLAVHSAKDLTSELAPGCEIICIPKRAAVHDVVVGGRGATGEQRLLSLPPGAVVGTSSMRRRALLAELRADLEVAEFRGNLDTRLQKVASGTVDAAVLAAAGIERLGAGVDEGAAGLDPDRWIPAPAQGALAVEAALDRSDLRDLLAPLTDPAAWAEVTAERSFARRLEGGCSVPLGCRARAHDGSLIVSGFLGHPDGSESLRDRVSGPAEDAMALGHELAEAMLRAGGEDLRDEVAAWETPRVEAP